MRNLGNRVYSAIYWLSFGLISLPLFLFNLTIFLLTFPFDPKGVLISVPTCFWAWLGITMNPLWHLEVEGRNNIQWGKTYILVSNHQSVYDIFVLFCLFRPFKWLAKKSLFKIPFIGWNMSLNRYIPIQRDSLKNRVAALQDCRKWLRRGVSIIIFPEGTRSETREMRIFHSGAFRLAIEEKIHLVPIAITGTSDILQKHSFLLGPGKIFIKIKVLPPIDASQYDPHQIEELKERAYQEISHEIQDSSKTIPEPTENSNISSPSNR